MIRAIKIQISTQKVLSRGKYPRHDMQPINNLEADVEWLILYEPSPRPTVDERLYDVVRNESITTTPHPDYPHLNQFLISYSTTQKVDAEIERMLEAVELQANETHFPVEQHLKYLTLGLGVVIHFMEGNTPTAKMIVVKDKIKALALRLWNNDQVLQNKVTELSGGTLPDPDTNWDKND